MHNPRTPARAARPVLAVLAACCACAAGSAEPQKNTTGLPTYPHDQGGRMDAVSRSLPNGQNCIHYASSTTDPLLAVIDWYKTALPGARVEDVNKDSLYGNYFKLDGVKLLVGNDIVNVYRMTGGPNLPNVKKDDAQKTTIELFKCSDAQSPKRD
ncbi:MAG TPA: hypothetical protein VGL55_08010 [Steroidobacteraceae bacterium]|jgi:hypothetical protein